MEGIEKEGMGAWKIISENYVTTKTTIQLASHAQKFKVRNTKTHEQKRRTSINDISLDLKPNQSVLDSEDLQHHTSALDTQGFQSNHINSPSNPKDWLPNKLNFTFDS